MKSSIPFSRSGPRSRLFFLAFVAFPVVQSAAALLSRSRRDASRFLFQGVAYAAAAGWSKAGHDLERWVLELGAMLEGGVHEIGGRKTTDPFSLFR
ncbi:hypothetical protein [Methylacidimicrobium cyclopophantes]|uniref:hypothetical protein n=1 Tax=Methylacidimicrobium cyclopophantes TaxID=1041766 RepID=UPI0015B5D36B|nr:hypothetical protein [Methylacidimicrobium cyclopophantes]